MTTIHRDHTREHSTAPSPHVARVHHVVSTFTRAFPSRPTTVRGASDYCATAPEPRSASSASACSRMATSLTASRIRAVTKRIA
jgi:hypothetical protein